MKIDIGQGKILGTKRVSPNGQVSGFTEYAGREVLVILPDSDVEVQLDAKEYLDEMRSAVDEHMRLAFNEYGELRQKFRDHRAAAAAFIESNAPKSFSGLYDKVEHWLKDQRAAKTAKRSEE